MSGDASLGVLRPAALDGAPRPPAVEVPTREPLRWLTAPPPPDARRGASADAGTDASAAAGEGDLVYVHFEDDALVRLDAGAGFEFRDLDTDAPWLRLGDGSTFIGRWEEALGTCMVFTEEAAAAAPPQRRVRHAGHTEARLVMRRVPPPADAAAAAGAS